MNLFPAKGAATASPDGGENDIKKFIALKENRSSIKLCFISRKLENVLVKLEQT